MVYYDEPRDAPCVFMWQRTQSSPSPEAAVQRRARARRAAHDLEQNIALSLCELLALVEVEALHGGHGREAAVAYCHCQTTEGGPISCNRQVSVAQPRTVKRYRSRALLYATHSTQLYFRVYRWSDITLIQTNHQATFNHETCNARIWSSQKS